MDLCGNLPKKYIILEKLLFSILTQPFQPVIPFLLQTDYYLFMSFSIVVLEQSDIKVHVIYITYYFFSYYIWVITLTFQYCVCW